MSARPRVSHEGREYEWNGRQWFDVKSGEIPPVSVAVTLNGRIAETLAASDAAITNFGELLDRARGAREAKQWRRAEHLARQALVLRPGDPGALASLCAALRALSRPEIALAESAKPSGKPTAALLTTRAAAMCDLGMWPEAKREVGRALAMGTSGEAYNVVHRIKSARPELYEKPDSDE